MIGNNENDKNIHLYESKILYSVLYQFINSIFVDTKKINNVYMKKIVMLIAFMAFALSGYSQFEQGKYYVGASLTGLDLSYSGAENFNIGLDLKGGYLLADDWMITAQAGIQHSGNDDVANSYSIGIGGRYYIVQNGLYLGVNAKLIHANHNYNYNDLMPGIEVGYAFFLNRTVTIEPAVYYDQSFKNHSDFSKIGLRIGVGVYL